MMKVSEIYQYIDSFAPFESACSWDNSGLLVGDMNAEVSKVLLCLDVTEETIRCAVKEGAQLIVAHHPVIFKPLKSFLSNSVPFMAAAESVNIICAHTNLDKAVGGVNDALCEKLNLSYIKLSDAADGFLNIITLEEDMTPKAFAEYASCKLNAPVSFVTACENIRRIAVCSGSGADFIEEALLHGCDAFLTGEISYHKFLDAVSSGISAFAAGHYETEIPVVDYLKNRMSSVFSDVSFITCKSENFILTEH